MTIATVNKAIKHLGYRLNPGVDYFYFTPLTADIRMLRDDSVMVYRLGNSVDFWLNELADKINEQRG